MKEGIRALMGLLLLISFQGCLSRREIQAAIWLNNTPIPKEICEQVEDLKLYGFYRRLDSGKLEFMSFCNKEARNFIGMHKDDFERLLNSTIPEENSGSSLDYGVRNEEIQEYVIEKTR